MLHVAAPERSKTAGKLGASLALAASVLLLPQLPLLLWWVQARSVFHSQSLLNAEFLFLLALALIRPSFFLLCALVLSLLADLVAAFGLFYYFQPTDTLRDLRYIVFLPPERLAAYLTLLLLYIALCATVLRSALSPASGSKVHRRTTLLLAAVLLTTIGVDLHRGRYNLLPSHAAEAGDLMLPRLTRTPMLSLARNYIRQQLRMSARQGSPLPSTLDRALAKLPSGSRPDILLVLTESWGIANDRRIDQAELAPYFDPRLLRRYNVETGGSPFLGSTTSGETRELCAESGGRWAAAPFKSCRPAQLERKGYRTLAVHGFTPAIYDRDVWYSQFGFQRAVFLSDLQHDGVPLCGGTFPGACDGGVTRWLAAELTNGRDRQPLFVHWVTLNSHLPVPDTVAESAGEDCRPVGLAGDRSLCSLFRLVQRVHRGVASLALTPGLRPTVFVIVGDHAPPFLRENARDRFSQTAVPYVILTPRALDGPAPPLRLQAADTSRRRHPSARRNQRNESSLHEPSENAATSDTQD